MNWRVSALDRYTLVSNSDAHSPEKLGREATLFDTELSYDAFSTRLHSGDPATYLRHGRVLPRRRQVSFRRAPRLRHRLGPADHAGARRHLPGLRQGSDHRRHAPRRGAGRPARCGGRPARTHPFHSLIPLPEVLGEVYGVGASSKQVQAEYIKLLGRLGPELAILRDVPLEEIAAVGGTRLAEGIGRMRRGEVLAAGGLRRRVRSDPGVRRRGCWRRPTGS